LTFAQRAYNRGWANDDGGSTQLEDTFPDVSSMTDQELKELIDQLTDEEREVSYRRRLLHGKIDILRAELVNRLRAKREAGDVLITGEDVQQLTDILAGRVPQPQEEDA
jgi:CO dehydrogenase/acetyl-CoA synthase alpha subunit